MYLFYGISMYREGRCIAVRGVHILVHTYNNYMEQVSIIERANTHFMSPRSSTTEKSLNVFAIIIV